MEKSIISLILCPYPSPFSVYVVATHTNPNRVGRGKQHRVSTQTNNTNTIHSDKIKVKTEWNRTEQNRTEVNTESVETVNIKSLLSVTPYHNQNQTIIGLALTGCAGNTQSQVVGCWISGLSQTGKYAPDALTVGQIHSPVCGSGSRFPGHCT